MERIYVTVRPRPLSSEDAKSSPWRISGNSISLSNNQSNNFDFDQIFQEDCTTRQVYEARTKDIVAAAADGFNGTVFAYGQTNSGKTHTMRGSTVEPGVILLAVHDLFHTIQEDVDREFLLRMSYMEIYNEEINDLLAPEHRKLQIHENLERGIFVAGLREEIVCTPEQVLQFMEFGESHRHIGETNMNVYSSRSHTIFRMIIESRIKPEDGSTSCDAVRVSVLNLVDLAGSERAAKTGAEGMRLKEGSHINKSLMTLGTVIKKLSEGAESQGGHVPYRDSKLTRILQPSLGGNANTAIICNITLAQIHADETKSSLQFASRALRVTNCARVNEIMTDAALLKRQKKEIEELRARLQGSHVEHFEEEILSLRNTLLQSELERERIALELQEEKKAKALKERRLQEQAKKIQNLSSMVLNSNVDEKHFANKKDKRRETWCLSVLSRGRCREVSSSTTPWKLTLDPIRPERDMGLPLPFEELDCENESVKDHIPEGNVTPGECSSNVLMEYCSLPDARLLLNITNRRKTQTKRNQIKNESAGTISVKQQNNESVDMQAEYESLLIEFESQRIMKDIEIECLTKKLAEEGCIGNSFLGDKSLTLRESEAILVIKQLQEQVKMLEMEKCSVQQNLDDVIELATKNNISSVEKYEELYMTHEEFCVKACIMKDSNVELESELMTEVQVIESELQSLRNTFESVSALVDELFQYFAVVSDMFLDTKTAVCQNAAQLRSVTKDHQEIHTYMEKKHARFESEKAILYSESIKLHKQIEELTSNLHEAERESMARCEQQGLEKAELLSHIGNLEKEISGLSSSSLAREKETLRKEFEKTKLKLKETDFKLKNTMQEKTKLEGEKAQAEREIKRLHGQMNFLQRDICKRDSLAGRRRDSFADRRRDSKAFDSNRAKDNSIQNEQTMQGEYKRLEVLAFEMETTIASLEEELAVLKGEKEEAFLRNEVLASELEATSNKLNVADSELKMLQEELSSIRITLAESESSCQRMEGCINMLKAEKEELAMQFADTLLDMDEEKAIWASKEKASIETIAEKTKRSNAELMLLSKEISEVRRELETCREESKVLRERLNLSEDNMELERKWSREKSSEINQLRQELNIASSESEKCYNITVNNTNDKAKLKMRLRSTQAKLDAFRGRYDEARDEIDFIHKKYEEASGKLKEQLASYGVEVLHLKKLLAARSG